MVQEKNYLNLDSKIDENRKKLEDMISRHDSINHDEILLISQQLDELITLFYRERKEKEK
ncbi:Spo0E like sporulation regulatory protein [Geosporobacter subterraneus DSM 17957]|uniref:Spo0E like sporulation regulatory protein n=1 Tax=Geosporobacter subterraneus DSM 17957 TaxID=1121919 RepID=A0A1M6CRU2_9FIRM|nr:Spo0E family sporulation regulatory protein-aspartic acid phosphatase [Geosporobacter subterraneus]SHI63514.1 Spo0E like sporulation regulatory protein [Geosporobacter subterraneus DSM 17957]